MDYAEFLPQNHKLNAPSGRELYRLPSEAEWEYACRAGTNSRWSFGDDDGKLGDHAWYNKNAWDVGEKDAHRVGLKCSNSWGLHDMYGNVLEWCGDWFPKKKSGSQVDLVGSSPYRAQVLPPAGLLDRVLRGGDFGASAHDA